MCELRGNASKIELVIPDSLLPLKDFDAVHDPLHVRALYLESDQSWLLISLELTSLPVALSDQLRAMVAEACDMSRENIWITVTHTFSAPHLTEETAAFGEIVKQRVLQAAQAAQSDLCRLGIEYVTTFIPLNVNRNVPTAQGWWLGQNPDLYSNHEASVVKLVDLETQKMLALLLNYDVSASVMINSFTENGHKQISTDFIGHAALVLEKAEDLICLFLLGAAGDQAPIKQSVIETVTAAQIEKSDLQVAGFQFVCELGNQLAAAIKPLLKNSQPNRKVPIKLRAQAITLPRKLMPVPTKELRPAHDFNFEATGEMLTITLEAVLLGDILILGTQPELNSHFGQQIRAQLPFGKMLLGTMINGANKYLPEAWDYQQITYIAMNSPFALGSSDRVMNGFQELLHNI